MMGLVTERLLQLVKKHVTRYGIVVWYDPPRHYADVVATLNLPDTTVHRFQGSFFLLRHEIEPYLAQKRVPNLVIYVDADRSSAGSALAEVEAAGVVLEPGGARSETDTSLASIGRGALSGMLSRPALEEILRNDSLTLRDLDRIAQGTGPVTGAISLVFGNSASPSDVALEFLTNSDKDDTIINKSAQDDLITLLQEALGLSSPTPDNLPELRTQLTRHILLTDFRAAIVEKIEAEILPGVPRPGAHWQIEACQMLIARWRDSVKHRSAYESAAYQVEQEYGIQNLDLPQEAWQIVETFPCTEEILLARAEQKILDEAYDEAIKLAKERQDSFWNVDENALRWSLIRTIASLHLTCANMQEGLGKRSWSAGEMVFAYTQGFGEGTNPWYILDTLYRHMERLHFGFGATSALDKAVGIARDAYTAVVQRMTEIFGEALLQTQFHVPEVAQQLNTFRGYVAPELDHGKVAYFWIDALRFEMAHELLSSLSNVSQISLTPALATLPTVTEVGMAALLPGAERGLGLAESGGKLASEVNDQPLRLRKDRIDYLMQRGGYTVEVFTLADMMKLSRMIKERIQRAQLIVVTSQEIDGIAEQQPPYLARNAMDDVLLYIKRAMHQLAELGVNTFIITSDHGFLFGDELKSDMMIDPPGGRTVKLTQRVWVGRGGTTPAGCVRVKASEIGLAGDLELIFPPGLASFVIRGGADPYCHGGFSLQELVVPVLTVQMSTAAEPLTQGDFSLIMERPQVTARVFTVAADYRTKSLFDTGSRRVYCTAFYEGEVVARAEAAAYGYDHQTKQIILENNRTNYITLMMMSEVKQGFLTVSLIDAETEAELKHLDEVEVKIAI